MELWQSLLLGAVQGITEWLPISSSGHLVILQNFLGLTQPIYFDIMLHLATVLVILFFFSKDIKNIVMNFWDFNSKEFKTVMFILLGSIPTAALGFLFHDLFVKAFSSLVVVGTALVLTGVLLDLSKRSHYTKEMKWWHAVLIGVVQGFAIVPGASRSGLTIALALMFGIKRKQAATFSFLLAVPAIIGAAIFEWNKIPLDIPYLTVGIGMMAAFVVGYISLGLLMVLIEKNTFHQFRWYCWIVGFGLLIYNLLVNFI